MGCGVYWQQVHEIEKALATMERFGIDPGSEGVVALQGERAKLMAQVGFKFPRTVTPMSEFMVFLSPAIRVWHDSEQGWMSEARAKPGAAPVYKAASDEVAMAILKRDITPELEAILLTPDVGIDN